MKLIFSNDEWIKSHAVGEVLNAGDYNLSYDPPRPVIGGIYDPKIFGMTKKCECGLVNIGRCPSCGYVVYDEKTYLSNFAYYWMHNFIITEEKLIALLQRLDSIGIRLPKFSRNNLVNLYSTEFSIYDNEAEFDDDVEVFEVINKDTDEVCQLVLEEVTENSDEQFCALDGLMNLRKYTLDGQSFDFLDEYINAVLPISSPGLRAATFPKINGQIQKHFESINHADYKHIIYFDNYLTQLLSKVDYPVVDKVTIHYLFNLMYIAHVRNSEIFNPSKESLIRNAVTSHVGSSMRFNAISHPTATIEEAFLPRSGVYHALQWQIIQRLVDEDSMSINAQNLYENKDPKAIKAMEDILEESVVLVNRNPTLHRNNILQFKPRLWNENAIGMNPYLCKSFGMDFDGDQLAAYIITDEKQRLLLGDRIEAKNLWVFDKTHEPAFMPDPVTAFGLYSASLVVKKTKPKKFEDFKKLEEAFNQDIIQVDDQVILLPGKSTTYGREKLSKILGTDIENIIENNPLDIKNLAKVISGLIDHPKRVQIIQDLQVFGNEIATLIGIDILPIKDMYKDMAPQVEAIQNDPDIPEVLKVRKIMEVMPSMLSAEINKLSDSNMETLLKSGGRISIGSIKSMYTPYIRTDDNGKVKIGDSTLASASGLSEEELVTASHTQRDILGIKQGSLSTGGYNQRQLVIAAMNFIFSDKDNKETSYIFVPESLAVGRKILPEIQSEVSTSNERMVAMKSSALSKSKIIYKDEVSKVSSSSFKNGAGIGFTYAKALTEVMTQAQMSLKYGGLMNDFSGEDIISHVQGKAIYDEDSITIGQYTYRLGENIIPSEKVMKGEEIKVGDVIAVNANLANVEYRLSSFVTFLDMKVVTNSREEFTSYYRPKALSYAFKPGIISYKDGCMYLDDVNMGKIVPTTTYFYPEGYYVSYGDRLCSDILDLGKLMTVLKPEYVFYLFYKELLRVCSLAGKSKVTFSLDLVEIVFKALLTKDFTIKKSLTKLDKSENLLERLYYGAARQGLTQAVKSKVQVNEDNDQVEIEFADNDTYLARILLSVGMDDENAE